MFAVALVFKKDSSIVSEIWVDIEAQSSEEAIEIATDSVASSVWRLKGYAIVNSAAIVQESESAYPVEETIAPVEETIASPEDDTIVEVVEAKPRRRKKAAKE